MNSRIKAIDILRGFTIAGMILVNNPGGGEENTFTPLLHAEWIGLTPTDLVFPFFMFIMGVTTYLSLKKYNFAWSKECVVKILRRGALLWLVGLAITWLFMFSRGMLSDDNAALGIGERIVNSACCFENMRLLGVLPRLGICYALAALVTISVKHNWLPWVIAGVFIAYYVILETCGGWAHDDSNIIDIIDKAVLGASHVYKWDTPDPEGLLSTVPAVGHVLIGVCVGRVLSRLNDLNEKIERLFIIGALMTFAGFLLSYGCPISKKLWTPTFALVTCGFASTLLALLTWFVDKKGNPSLPPRRRGDENAKRENKVTSFFDAFGVNPLAMYIISDLLLLPCSIWPLVCGTTIQDVTYNAFATVTTPEMSSLIWALIYIAINWAVAYTLKKKGIIFKL